MPTENQGAILHLTAAGVSVLVDATDGYGKVDFAIPGLRQYLRG